MAELKIQELPLEVGRKLAVRSLAEQCDAVLKALIDRFGREEAHRIVHPYLHALGRSIGEGALKRGLVGDATGIATQAHFAESQLFGVEGEVVEVSPERVVKQVKSCPMEKCSVDFCKSFECLLSGVCEAMNPEYRWYMTKIIPAGDSICEWVVEKCAS